MTGARSANIFGSQSYHLSNFPDARKITKTVKMMINMFAVPTKLLTMELRGACLEAKFEPFSLIKPLCRTAVV